MIAEVRIGFVELNLFKVAVMSLLSAASVVAVRTGSAVYHDGLRTSIPELWRGGRDRAALAKFSYTLSIGFIVAYALPYSFATGILIIHLILLAADMIGLASGSRAVAVAGGLLYGVLATLVVDGFVSFVRLGAGFAAGLDQLFVPLLYSFPLLAAVAIGSQHGLRWGIVASLGTVTAWRLADMALHGGGIIGPLTPSGGAIALAAVTLGMVGDAVRRSSPPVADASLYAAGAERIRGRWPALVGPPVLISVAASQGWLAGEPVQLVLVNQGSLEAAAAVAFFSAVGFLPMIAMSGLLSGVWNQDGYPDWYLGAGYLLRHPLLAGIGGLALIAAEIGSLRWVGRFLNTHAQVHAIGSAARDALDTVPTFSILAGGVAASLTLAGPIGVVAVVGAYALNEAKHRPIMPLAVPVFAYLGVALAVQAVRASGWA